MGGVELGKGVFGKDAGSPPPGEPQGPVEEIAQAYGHLNHLSPGARVGIASSLAPTKPKGGLVGLASDVGILGSPSSAGTFTNTVPAVSQLTEALEQLNADYHADRGGASKVFWDVFSGAGGQADQAYREARSYIRRMAENGELSGPTLEQAQSLVDEAEQKLRAYQAQKGIHLP
jgi:hypothetical protein